MQPAFAATPLPTYKFQAHIFANGFSIRQIEQPSIRWDLVRLGLEKVLGDDDIESLIATQLWLCAEQPGMESRELLGTLWQAVLSMQIVCPFASRNIFLAFTETSTGYVDWGNDIRQPSVTGLIGKITSPKHVGFTDYDNILAGVRKAFSQSIIRLVNPLYLLQLGLESNHRYVPTLLLTAALDMLVMAGGSTRYFCDRVHKLLGSTTYVFPKTELDRQPKHQMNEVTEELWNLRSHIAHGKRIPENLRAPCSLFDIDNRPINVVNYSKDKLLKEAALYILCAALQKVLCSSLIDTIGTDKAWRSRLT